MADSLSISPVALFSPAGVSPVAFALPANGRPAPAISGVASRDSVVDISANGQLLSALFSIRSALETLPVDTQTTLAAATQSLIEQAGTLEAAVASTVVPPTIPLPLARTESAPVATNGVPPLPVTTASCRRHASRHSAACPCAGRSRECRRAAPPTAADGCFGSRHCE